MYNWKLNGSYPKRLMEKEEVEFREKFYPGGETNDFSFYLLFFFFT